MREIRARFVKQFDERPCPGRRVRDHRVHQLGRWVGSGTKPRWKRYEKPQPGHRVQIDVKFIAPLKGSRKKHYQFTAIDDCTRIRVLRIYDRLKQTAMRFVDYVSEKLPFAVEVIQTAVEPSTNHCSTTRCWTRGPAASTSGR